MRFRIATLDTGLEATSAEVFKVIEGDFRSLWNVARGLEWENVGLVGCRLAAAVTASVKKLDASLVSYAISAG